MLSGGAWVGVLTFDIREAAHSATLKLVRSSIDRMVRKEWVAAPSARSDPAQRDPIGYWTYELRKLTAGPAKIGSRYKRTACSVRRTEANGPKSGSSWLASSRTPGARRAKMHTARSTTAIGFAGAYSRTESNPSRGR